MSVRVTRALPLLRMAAKDLLHEWSVSLAICLAITAVAAPILVLIALHDGVVSEIFSGLRNDPAAREIRLAATGAARFDAGWFETVRGWPEVAFAVPSTRYASAQGQVFNADGTGEARASLIPTGAGDPVFAPDGLLLATATMAALSASLAAEIGAGIGDRVELEVSRSGVGGPGIEHAALSLEIVAIARPADFARDAVFVAPATMIEVEDFKNGHRAPLFGIDGTAPPPRDHFPDFRLYAHSIGDVAPLVERLEGEPWSLTLRTEGARIDFAMRMDRSLGLVVGAIGTLGILGLGGGLATIQWSMAARRRRTIAVLSLIGFGRPALIGLPVIQALMLAALGSIATVAAAGAFTLLVDAALAGTLGDASTRLGLGAIGLVTAIIFAVSLVPALWIGILYSKLDPSDEIRET